MAAKMQRGLGRGLGALLGEAAENSEAARDEVRSLKLTDIDPNRGQPRERFEETALTLTTEQAEKLTWFVTLTFPLVIICIGFAVFVRRRHL